MSGVARKDTKVSPPRTGAGGKGARKTDWDVEGGVSGRTTWGKTGSLDTHSSVERSLSVEDETTGVVCRYYFGHKIWSSSVQTG